MKIRYVKQIEGSPVVQFVARAWCALMKEGQWDCNSVLVSSDLQCVFASEGRRIIGCLTFHLNEAEAVVNIAYVLPAFRGKGVYKAMHEKFVALAKEQGARSALNICYPTNTAIQETVKKLGYRLHCVHWVRPL